MNYENPLSFRLPKANDSVSPSFQLDEPDTFNFVNKSYDIQGSRRKTLRKIPKFQTFADHFLGNVQKRYPISKGGQGPKKQFFLRFNDISEVS